MERVNPCPLCEYEGCSAGALEDHLLSHSKESLVNYLLQRGAPEQRVKTVKSNCRSDPPTHPSHSQLLLVKRTSSRPQITTTNQDYHRGETATLELRKLPSENTKKNEPGCSKYSVCTKITRKSENANRNRDNASAHGGSPTHVRPHSVGESTVGRTKPNSTTAKLTAVDNEIPGSSLHSKLNISPKTEVTATVSDQSVGQEARESGSRTTSRSPTLQKKSAPEVVAANIPNIVNSTATIKYIIENGGSVASVSHEEQFIIVDGRLIPVYNCTGGSTSYENPPSPGMTQSQHDRHGVDSMSESISLKSGGSNVDVDLMTDEEIPPKGEISEFEESSTSFMSDDIQAHSAYPDGMEDMPQSFNNTILLMPENRSAQQVDQDRTKIKVAVGPSSTELSLEDANKFASALRELKSGICNAQGIPCESFSTTLPRPQSPNQDFKVPLLPDLKPKKAKIYFCIYCDWTSSAKSAIAAHMQTDHPGKASNPGSFECARCGKMFDSRPSLRKHLLVHKEKQFVCQTCSKAFPSNYKLQEHKRIHDGVYPYACSSCAKRYRTPSLLATHEKRHHPKPSEEKYEPKKTEFMCPVCHRIIHSKRNLNAHLLLHKQKPVKCPHCSETYARQSVLIRHIRACHNASYEAPKTKECTVCGKMFHPNSLKAHMLIHNQEKPHECPVCHKNFRTLGNLNNHSWSHKTVERPFKCPQCPKSYIFSKALQNHAMVHKRKTFHFVCNECGVKFTNKNNLKRHVEEHGGEKKYECLVCEKRFFRQYYLVEHYRIHNGTRPFTCSICGKASSTKSNHLSHIKIHDARESGSLEG